MRKLSKKISMLMVLAMLVSLFSGIVSASAAAPSSWSFKSSKYDVAVGETIEMEKNEYADFDLFRYDAAPEGYTVKWSSSDSDAVWVNAKTGQLRADKFKTADYGDKATISATFTNTKTGKSSTRSFVIEVAEKADYEIAVNFGDEAFAVGQKYDLKAVVKADGKEVEAKVAFAIDGKAIDAAYTPAEEGEFTIVTTATIDGKVVATAKTPVVVEVVKAAFVKAVQKSLNTVVLTLSNEADAKKIVDNSTLLTAEYYVNNLTVPTPIKSVAAVKDDAKSIEVVLYNNLIKDLKHSFIYGDANIAVVGTSSDPARIEVIGATYEYQTLKDLVLKVYNAQNVDITADINLLTRVIWEADPSEDFYLSGGQIYFYNENKVAKVKATLDMGLNDNYEEIQDLTAEGVYASVKSPDVTYAPHGYKFEGDDNFSSVLKMAVLDPAKRLEVAFKYQPGAQGWADEYKIVGNTDTRIGSTLSYTYYSSDKTVVMVGENTGYITPVAPGNTVVYIKSKDSITQAESTVGTIAVSVVAPRKLDSASVYVNGNMKLSVDDAVINNVELKYSIKDQLGADYDGNVAFEYAITYPNDLVGSNFSDYFAVAPNATGDKLTLTQGPALQAYLTAVQANGKAYETFKIKVTVKEDNAAVNGNWGGKFEYVVTLLAREVNTTAVQSRSLGFTNTNIDMKLSQNYLTSYQSTLSLGKYDNQGFYLGNEAPLTVVANKNAVTGAGYSVLLKKDGQAIATDTKKIVDNGDGTFTFNAVYTDGALKKMDKGTYTAELYKVGANSSIQFLGTKALILSDTSESVSVKIANDKIQVAPTLEQLKEAIKFFRGTTEITSKVSELVSFNSTATTDPNHIYVRSVKVKVDANEMQWNNYGYSEIEFTVNKLFEVK